MQFPLYWRFPAYFGWRLTHVPCFLQYTFSRNPMAAAAITSLPLPHIFWGIKFSPFIKKTLVNKCVNFPWLNPCVWLMISSFLPDDSNFSDFTAYPACWFLLGPYLCTIIKCSSLLQCQLCKFIFYWDLYMVCLAVNKTQNNKLEVKWFWVLAHWRTSNSEKPSQYRTPKNAGLYINCHGNHGWVGSKGKNQWPEMCQSRYISKGLYMLVRTSNLWVQGKV